MFRTITSRVVLPLASSSTCPACSSTLLPRPPPSLRRFLHASFTTSNLSYESQQHLPPTTPLPPFSLPAVGVEPVSSSSTKPKTPRRTLKAKKAAISLSPTAVIRIQELLSSPTPQLIRIGVRNKGCAGMSYHLEYVEKPDRFDEVVEQDGVKVVIDSKALFSIIGSTMDWEESVLGAKFVFANPNIKDACGCGESFIV